MKSPLTLTLLVFVLALAAFLALYSTSPLLYDSDSYYHLAIARAQAEEGLKHDFPWARFGLLSRSFADKEALFHLYLVPFVTQLDPLVGGRLALAILDALLLTLIGWLAIRAIGPWGALVPFWMVITSAELGWRLVRLRAELGSLALLLVALSLAGHRRFRLLGLVAVVYALSYTAIHAFVGLFVLLFLLESWIERRPLWGLALYPLAGAGLGLLVHPHFPRNLALWWYQTVELFSRKGALDVGTELSPNFTDVTLMVNLGWLLGLLVLWHSTERGGRQAMPDGPEWARLARAFGLAATVFAGLYLLMSRFSVYAIPLVTLWLLFEIRRRGWSLGRSTRLPGGASVPLAAAWLICLLVGLPVARAELGRFRERTSAGPDQIRIREREAFAAAIPAGAHVLAPWRATPLYMFWAPQGRYVNVLDPVFLAASEPALYEQAQSIFGGREPDVPQAASRSFDSELLALSTVTADATLLARLAGDPRVEVVHRGINGLFRFRAAPGSPFVRQWSVAPATGAAFAASPEELESWPAFPWANDSRGLDPGPLEAYVEASRAGEGCVRLVHRLTVEQPSSVLYELASRGPAELWLDGSLLAAAGDSDAVLSRGLLVPLSLEAGEHRLLVVSCPADESRAGHGFYLLRRQS